MFPKDHNFSFLRTSTKKKAAGLWQRIPVPHDLFKVHAHAAKVIFVCCFRDPRGLLSRERDMFRRQAFEV